MGTRGAWGFLSYEQEKVTYNHFDSYPSELGLTMKHFAQAVAEDELQKLAQRITLVCEEDTPPRAAVAVCVKLGLCDESVGDPRPDGGPDWYQLLRNAQGDPEVYRKNKKLVWMIDSKQFLLDSLFCEWAYIINLTTGRLECYCGFNQNQLKKSGRYAGRTPDLGGRTREPGHEYYGVMLIADIPLEELADIDDDEFCEVLEWRSAQLEYSPKEVPTNWLTSFSVPAAVKKKMDKDKADKATKQAAGAAV